MSGPQQTLYSVDLSQLDDIIDKLRKTSTSLLEVFANDALPKINAMILSQARGAAPVGTGLLRDSLAEKIKKYRRGEVVVSITGVDSKAFRPGGTRIARKTKMSKRGQGKRVIRQKGDSREVKVKPAHYFHLVELGTKHMTARPFFNNTINALQQDISGILREAFEKALADAQL